MLKKLLFISIGLVTATTQATSFTQCSNDDIKLHFRALPNNQTQLIVNYQQQRLELLGNMVKSTKESANKPTSSTIYNAAGETDSSSLLMTVTSKNEVHVQFSGLNQKVAGDLRCSSANKDNK